MTATSSKIEAIIVLAPGGTARPLVRFFTQFNSSLKCCPTDDLKDLVVLARRQGAGARLISFGSGLIVPQELLNRFHFGAYNFHPGPPAFPGWAPANFAIYHGATMFGATAHAMVANPDAGPIIGTELFPIEAGICPDHLATQAMVAMGRLLRRLGSVLVNQCGEIPALPIQWGEFRGSRAKFQRLSQSDGSLDPQELSRRQRAFGSVDLLYSSRLGRAEQRVASR